jgi:hypothetical protein
MINIKATGFYSYHNHADGLCCYRTKTSAIRHAIKSTWEKHEHPCVYTPTGREINIKNEMKK